MADLRMPEINYAVVAGNLTRDPIYKKTNNHSPVINFSIASNRKYKDGANVWQEDVCYINIVAWNKLADSCKEKLKKGSAILVDGELQSRVWKSEDGHTRSVVEIKARRIQFLNKKNYSTENSNTNCEEVFIDEEGVDYSEDTFDKFLSTEESDLLKKEI